MPPIPSSAHNIMAEASEKTQQRVAQLFSHLKFGDDEAGPLGSSATDARDGIEVGGRSEWDVELEELKLRLRMSRTVPDDDPGKKRQAQQGKLMVRARVEGMLDKDSLVEIGSIAGKGNYNDVGHSNEIEFVAGD